MTGAEVRWGSRHNRRQIAWTDKLDRMRQKLMFKASLNDRDSMGWKLDVLHPRRRLACEPRSVVVVNRRHLAISQIEAFEFHRQLGAEPVAHPSVEARRGL